MAWPQTSNPAIQNISIKQRPKSTSSTATSTWIKPPELAHVAFKSQGSVRRAAPLEGSGGGLEHSKGAAAEGVGRAGGGRQTSGGGRQSEAGGAVGKSEGGPQTLHNAQMFYRSSFLFDFSTRFKVNLKRTYSSSLIGQL